MQSCTAPQPAFILKAEKVHLRSRVVVIHLRLAACVCVCGGDGGSSGGSDGGMLTGFGEAPACAVVRAAH